jgi:hypothetical protein
VLGNGCTEAAGSYLVLSYEQLRAVHDGLRRCLSFGNGAVESLIH